MSNCLKPSVCIVTPDLLGPVRNGGIGTACTLMAEEIARMGYDTTILFAQSNLSPQLSDSWIDRYKGQGIKVVVDELWNSDSKPPIVFPAHPPLAMAHQVYCWLKRHHFELVFFIEWQGSGFYALQAKRAGLHFQKSIFVTHIHSPSLWHAINNVDISSDPLTSLTYHMERKSVEWADAVVSPSKYMLDWVRRYGFNPPARSVVLPNFIEHSTSPRQRSALTTTAIDELVFFGRLEYRKGLVQFCDALDRLVAAKVKISKVSFLGKFAKVAQQHSALFIASRATRWPFLVELHVRLDRAEAVSYLSNGKRLAVMPSVADNSPYTVYECLTLGLPFLARDVGGVGELIDRRDHSSCLFDGNPRSLSSLLEKALTLGVRVPRLAFDLIEHTAAWGRFVDALVRLPTRSDSFAKNKTPKVSVCLTHYNRPKLLRQALNSLLVQDYGNFEVILVDDGSTSLDAINTLSALEPLFRQRGWKILRQLNSYPGNARNTAARQAKGKFILFMDDDNVAKKNMLSCFVKAALSTGADLVTSVFDVFSGSAKPSRGTPVLERALPVGDIVSFSLCANAIGDTNALINRSFFKKLGGFTEDFGLGHEDFELYLRAVLSGAKVCVVPDATFWYRRNEVSISTNSNGEANKVRSFRPFLETLPAPLYELALLAFGLIPNKKRDVFSNEITTRKLTHEQKSRLADDDPDSVETVILVSELLTERGQYQFACQLLAGLSKSSQSVPVTLEEYIAKVMQAVLSADLKTLNSTLNFYKRSKAFDRSLIDPCQLVLNTIDLTNTNPEIVSILATFLASTYSRQICAQLDAAMGYGHIGNAEKSFKCFQKAMKLADSNYLSMRADVANAVKRKNFVNGFEHFYILGHAENSSWPEQTKFKKVSIRLKKNQVSKGDSSYLEALNFFSMLTI